MKKATVPSEVVAPKKRVTKTKKSVGGQDPATPVTSCSMVKRGGKDMNTSSSNNAAPCKGAKYRKSFKWSHEVSEEDREILCSIRTSMGGNPKGKCPKSVESETCWDKTNIADFIELYSEKMAHSNVEATRESISNFNTKFENVHITVWTFLEHLNIVMGRWVRPSELRNILPDLPMFHGSVVLTGTSHEDKQDPRVTSLINTFPSLGRKHQIFYVWIKPAKPAKLAIKHPEQGDFITIEHELKLYVILDDESFVNQSEDEQIVAVKSRVYDFLEDLDEELKEFQNKKGSLVRKTLHPKYKKLTTRSRGI
jgi:hypothetical protein